MAKAAGRASIAAAALALLTCPALRPAAAQDIGFGLADAYRYYADPGNGGGSPYAPFFDPYRGDRIVRGAYPDAYYDGYGFHYGKAAPPSLYVEAPPYLRGDGPRLRVGENETVPAAGELSGGGDIVAHPGRRRPSCARAAPHPTSRRCSARAR